MFGFLFNPVVSSLTVWDLAAASKLWALILAVLVLPCIAGHLDNVRDGYVQASRLCVLLCLCRKQTTLSFSLAHWTCNFFNFIFILHIYVPACLSVYHMHTMTVADRRRHWIPREELNLQLCEPLDGAAEPRSSKEQILLPELALLPPLLEFLYNDKFQSSWEFDLKFI